MMVGEQKNWNRAVASKLATDLADEENRKGCGTTLQYAQRASSSRQLDIKPSEYWRARNPGTSIERTMFNSYWPEEE